MFYLFVIGLLLLVGLLWWLVTPRKRAIVTPISPDGRVSQQSFLNEKGLKDRLLGSGLWLLVKAVLMTVGAYTIASWLW